MNVACEKTQRELKATRLALYRAAGVSGRGWFVTSSLGTLAFAVFLGVGWHRERERVHELQLRLLEFTERANEAPLPEVSGDVVAASLMQWAEWRYSRVKATVAADWSKVPYLLAPELIVQFNGDKDGQFNAPKLTAEIERSNVADTKAIAEDAVLVERMHPSTSRELTLYRYDVRLTLNGSKTEFRLVRITLKSLSDVEYRAHFRSWAELGDGRAKAYQKLNAARIEITDYSDITDFSRSGMATR